MRIHYLTRYLVLLLALFSLPAMADAKTPKEIVDDTTVRVLKLSEEARNYFDEDPDRFYAEIDALMTEVIDFNGFARSVMGKYASKKQYDLLKTKAEKDAFKANVRRFTETFREGLIKTYAKGLFNFNGQRAETDPVNPELLKRKSVTVAQRIYADANNPFIIHYSMRKGRSGDWKLRNVIIEGINIGSVYRSQFYSAVEEYNGDIPKVIDNWSSAAAGVEKAKKVEDKDA